MVGGLASAIEKIRFEIENSVIFISHNTDIEKEVTSPVEDFMLYKFTFDESNMIMYVGNHPEFPNQDIPKGLSPKDRIINKIKAKCYDWLDDDAMHSSQCLFNLTDQRDFPQYLHFAYLGVNESVKTKFQDIISSVEVQNQK